MAEVLGLGITHYPMLAGADTHMANLLKSTLKDPDIPADRKDVRNWPELAQREWGDDQGVAAAAAHRARLLSGLTRCREALDEFRPDVVVVWGDDQYENFREEVIPSFCVLAYDDTEVEAFAVLDMIKVPNAWGLPNDTTYRMRGLAGLRQAARDGRAHLRGGRRLFLRASQGRPFPARVRQHADLPRLRARGKGIPVSDRAHRGELLRRARHRPAGRHGQVRRHQGR